MRALILISLVCLSTACTTLTPEQQAERIIARYGPFCDKLGFQRDTDAWRSCVAREQARAAAAAMYQEYHAEPPKTCQELPSTNLMTCN